MSAATTINTRKVMGILAPRIIASEGEVWSVELEVEVDTLKMNGRGANEVAMFGSGCKVR
jgi:hypothetical protein